MLIETISLKSSRNPNIFIVIIDGKQYLLHSEIIVKYGISTNGEISQDKLDTVLFESDVMRAINQGMNYVSSKIITSKQLRDYLKTKQYSSQVIAKVIDKFNQYGVLDDLNFATQFVAVKQSNLSKRALENKLMQKGVNKNIIRDVLQDCDDAEVAIKTAEKFMKNKQYDEDSIAKLLRHLSYKGFDYDTINKALDYLKQKLN